MVQLSYMYDQHDTNGQEFASPIYQSLREILKLYIYTLNNTENTYDYDYDRILLRQAIKDYALMHNYTVII